MSMYWLSANYRRYIGHIYINVFLNSNLFEGYRTFTKEFQCGMGDKCCKLNGTSVHNGGGDTDEEVLFKVKNINIIQ